MGVLSPFPDVTWALHAGFITPQVYQPGIELIQQGAPSESVYFIVKGIAKLVHVHPGGEAQIVALRTCGWILGAAAAISARPYAASATTVTPCLLHRIPARRFRALLHRRARLSWYIHEMHSREVHEQLVQVAGLSALPARLRLERFLSELVPALGGRTFPRGLRLEIPLRHWEVAQLISVSAPYLSELLGELEAEGVLRREKGWIYLLEPGKLSRQDC